MAAPDTTRDALQSVDLASEGVRALNQHLHDALEPRRVRVTNPGGKHSIAVGMNVGHEVEIDGHVGYYCAGMNKLATVRVRGNCGVGVAENMMARSVLLDGSASQSAGASARGGLVTVGGATTRRSARPARCG